MNEKNIAVIALVVATVIILINSLRVTSLSILDTDPSTYVIVPIIMLPVFLLFEAKQKINPRPSIRDAIIGIVLFAIFIVMIAYLNFILSLRFIEFRIDILLLPLALSSIIIILFGLRNISAFRAPLIYILFGSPLLLMPIINFNAAFAQFNTIIVYSILHLFMNNVLYSFPNSISIGTNTLGIGESCAGIGALISVIFFLIPVAWLYDGKVKNKLYWVVSGFAILLALNILRMASIAGVWLAYGPAAVISYTHAFAGIFIFYATIIIMVLLPHKYALNIQKAGKIRKIARKETQTKALYYAIIIVMILSLIYYVISTVYQSEVHISPVMGLQATFSTSNPAISRIISNITNMQGYKSESFVGNENNIAVIFISNNTTGENVVEFAVTGANYSLLGGALANATLLGRRFFLGSDGMPSAAYYLLYNGNRIYLVYSTVPYASGGTYGEAAIYAIAYSNNTAITSSRCNTGNAIYSQIINTISFNFYNATTTSNLSSAYCFVKNAVGG